MSLTLLAWFGTFAVLAALSLRRPVYGVSLYLFSYFINPTFWWWGSPVRDWRWNLYAAVVLLVAVLVQHVRGEAAARHARAVGVIALLMVANALFVHFTLAPDRAGSATHLVLLVKFVVLYFLMVAAIRTPADLRVALWSIILCSAYIGYEVTINDRGHFSGGRLEGVGAAGVQNSNELASLLLAVVPFGGYLFLTGTRREKVLAALTTPLALNVLLLCNSRGAFLGLMAAGVIILTMAPRGVRGKIVKGVALGSLALVLLLRDPRIVERFLTVFVSSEERDASAETRTIIWSAALNQIRDHPFGAGGESFNLVYGRKYLPGVGYDSDGRAVHNGYLNEITNWGFQGLLLRLALFVVAYRIARRAAEQCARAGNHDGALLAACLISAAAGTMVSAIFGDYLDDEHLIWLAALMVVHGGVYADVQARIPSGVSRVPSSAGAPVPVVSEASPSTG